MTGGLQKYSNVDDFIPDLHYWYSRNYKQGIPHNLTVEKPLEDRLWSLE